MKRIAKLVGYFVLAIIAALTVPKVITATGISDFGVMAIMLLCCVAYFEDKIEKLQNEVAWMKVELGLSRFGDLEL